MIAFDFCFYSSQFSEARVCIFVLVFFHLFLLVFLGGAPNSICHFFRPSVGLSVRPSVHLSVCRAAYLMNRTSSDLNFWYTYIKWWYLQPFSSFFQNFRFLGYLWGKRTKNGPKWIIITSVTHHISGTVHHLIIIFGTHM